MSQLRGMSWDHPRGVGALRAVTATLAADGVAVAWEARSLEGFEETPIRELAAVYDLIAIDHPFMGQAHADGALTPLDELLPEGFLAEQAAASVGPSHASYRWEGHQWALGVDAAAQVGVYRADLLPAGGHPPATWEEVFELAAALPGGVRVALPASPTHLYASLLTLCHHLSPDRTLDAGGRPVWFGEGGLDPDVAAAALRLLYRLLDVAAPESLELNPIGLLDRMSAGAPVAYVPLAFGYSNYARPGYGRHTLTFTDVPTPDGHPAGSMLGGVGLAVSSGCRDLDAASAFLRLVGSADCQRGPYFRSGGQPGHRSAWTDAAVNGAAGGFFRNTLATLDHAFVRPRGRGYPAFQRDAGILLHRLAVRREARRR